VDLVSNMEEDTSILQTKIKKLSEDKEELLNEREANKVKVSEMKEKMEDTLNDYESKILAFFSLGSFFFVSMVKIYCSTKRIFLHSIF